MPHPCGAATWRWPKSRGQAGRPVLRVHLGKFPPHLLGLRLHVLDLNQPAFADPRTIGRRFLPCPRMVYQLGPEWEDPALGRFRRMDPATALDQEVTVRPPRYAQPHAIPRPVHIFALEGGRSHPHKGGRAQQVRLRQVNKPLLPATFRTSRLAFKPNSLPHCSIMICKKFTFVI